MHARTLIAALFAIGTTSSPAAISVITTGGGASLTIAHLGSDTFELIKTVGDIADPVVLTFEVTAGDAVIGGDNLSSSVFSDGATPITTSDELVAPIYQTADLFNFGARLGLNYVRVDLDDNGTYETVVEFTTGTTTDFSDDAFTRYAYDDTGADLSVADAVAAMAVPESSSFCLLGFGALALLSRRSRH